MSSSARHTRSKGVICRWSVSASWGAIAALAMWDKKSACVPRNHHHEPKSYPLVMRHKHHEPKSFPLLPKQGAPKLLLSASCRTWAVACSAASGTFPLADFSYEPFSGLKWTTQGVLEGCEECGGGGAQLGPAAWAGRPHANLWGAAGDRAPLPGERHPPARRPAGSCGPHAVSASWCCSCMPQISMHAISLPVGSSPQRRSIGPAWL